MRQWGHWVSSSSSSLFLKKVTILGLEVWCLATMAGVTHNASQKVTDYKEATSETSQRPAARLTLRQQVATRTRLFIGSWLGFPGGAFRTQLMGSQASAGGPPAPHMHRAVVASSRPGRGRERGALFLTTKEESLLSKHSDEGPG